MTLTIERNLTWARMNPLANIIYVSLLESYYPHTCTHTHTTDHLLYLDF